jgi:phosphate uptake regulator
MKEISVLHKVQRTPAGTFFVCLPRAWAEQHGLKKGVAVAITEASDGKLIIDPGCAAESSPRVAALKPGPNLGREILGCYLRGFDVIRVEAKERVDFEVRNIVRRTVEQLIGLEIVEDDCLRIVLNCLLEPSGLHPEKILRRNYTIVADMHRDAVNSIIDGDVELAKNVIARDVESNKLYFLLVRVLRTIIQNSSLREKLGVSPSECLDYRLAASLVEAIGDACVRMALKTVELEGAKISEELKKLLVELHTLCFWAHENAIKAFLNHDITLAQEVRNTRGKIEKTLANIEKATQAQTPRIIPQILAAASFIHQIYEHSVDISDLV